MTRKKRISFMRKKILIFGPISDFGGREVEVNIIAKSLLQDYDIKVLSSTYITDKSHAILGLKQVLFTSFQIKTFNSNWFLRQISKGLVIKNKEKKKAYAYVKNRISSLLFNFEKANIEILKEEIHKTDKVIACVQLSSKYIKELAEICYENNKPCFIRTTGTIGVIDVCLFDFLKKITCFIHHSEVNAENLNKQFKLPYTIIDQCSLNEAHLLALDIQSKTELRFGYLRRLSEEKGIIPVVDFFTKTDLPFVIAGDGIQKQQLLEMITDKPNCKYIGLLTNDNLNSFFDEIDVLIIPSYEESGPLVGLEAMAAGKIIISTKVGAMQERLNSLTSFWFNIENNSTLQAVINELRNYNTKELDKLSQESREKYIEQYSFKTIASKYKELLNNY